MLKQQNGIIVNISSGAGKQGFPRFSAYCASKFGVIGLSDSLACEVKEKGIKVFTICPGSINTKMYSQLLPEREAGRLDRSLLKPEYVAERIIQICLQNHKFETGSVIEIMINISINQIHSLILLCFRISLLWRYSSIGTLSLVPISASASFRVENFLEFFSSAFLTFSLTSHTPTGII